MNSDLRKITNTVFLFVLISVLCCVSFAQTRTSVSLGGAEFTVSPINAQNGTSTLHIGISTDVDVTNNAKATVRVVEQANFNGVQYTIDGGLPTSRTKTVDLAGGGSSTTVSFVFKTNIDNPSGGTIVSKVILESVTNALKGTPDTIQNKNLVVNQPQTSTCDDYIACPIGKHFNPITCQCEFVTPIIIDVGGNGFNLASGSDGVLFDFNGDGQRERFAWTSTNSDDAFLVLDRNNNGTIDDGQELFGNFTVQASVNEPNGFLALAVFDTLERGGNGDGRIDERDFVFQYLRLWRDANHNGISESYELSTLPALDVAEIELRYKESRRTDEHGNQFRYRAKVKDEKGAKVNRWAWDVIFVSSP